tara:strand:+ start:1613 stop:2260 length:648 start_codon:yes stop_codon:yes gene_type:complete
MDKPEQTFEGGTIIRPTLEKGKQVVFPLFPVSVYVVPYEKDFTKELEFIKTCKYRFSGTNYISEDTFILKHKELSNLSAFIQQHLDIFSKEMLQLNHSLVPTQSWVNKNPKQSWHHRHSHPNSILSGVFYLSTNKTSPIHFSSRDISSFHVEHARLSGCFFPVRTGDLIIFPSDLTHGVPSNQEDEERISLSFNTFSAGPIGNKENLTYLDISVK